MRALPLLLLLAGCSTPERKDEVCIDWQTYPDVVEECTPLYGNIICVTKEKTRTVCREYMPLSNQESLASIN